jgi:hypothetical protein
MVTYGDRQASLIDYQIRAKKRGRNRMQRVARNAQTEDKINFVGSALDAAFTAGGMIMAATGVGGIAMTVAKIAVNKGIQAIVGYVLRRGTKKQILASPRVLGGINYDKNLITDDHFNMIFEYTTGIDTPDHLVDILKVLDGIDLHRSMRQSISKPNSAVDECMRELGYSDPTKYGSITLKELHTRMGMTDDWRKTLRDAIETKGIDYNTSYTKWRKGGNEENPFEGDRRLDPKGWAKKRRHGVRNERRIKQLQKEYDFLFSIPIAGPITRFIMEGREAYMKSKYPLLFPDK